MKPISMDKPQLLDPATLPLFGKRLIEASAGTGKTYTISGLYLRLLLGQGIPAPLTCEQILVVTFTNAATEELRDRIRRRIQLAFKCFLGLPTKDPFVLGLYQATPEEERQQALKRLDLALKSLDEASIFTIHGFCQRILSDMAFESGLLFESEFTLDDSQYLHHSVRDFWRETCYPLSRVLAQAIHDAFESPEALLKDLRSLIGANQASPLTAPMAFDELAAQLDQNLSRLRLAWPRERDGLLALLHGLPLNGMRFGKASDGYPKLGAMFDAMDNWVRYGDALPPLKVLEALSLSELKLNKGGVAPSAKDAPLMAQMERLLQLIADIKPAFLSSAREGIARRFARQKQQHNILTPDDLLTSLAGAITAPGSALGDAIGKRFPVALIDEFQDTDPLQFAIFDTIYRGADGALPNNQGALALLMIGDPKQAIYAFRGADIHTYIQARAQTAARYHLGVNYRSSTHMVDAVNRLFQHNADPFISEAIGFDAVGTPDSARNKQLTESQPQSAALRLRLLGEVPQAGLNKATARRLLAGDAAAQIKVLLSDAQNGQCSIEGRPLIAKDIAILVRDRNEAAIMKQALSDRRIGAVFLSRDSVFDTVEARELALILTSLADPKDERALRSALATALLGYSAEEIHAFNLDEERRQTLLEQFFALHLCWQRRGIMPALLTLARDTRLIVRLLQTEDGERRLTDFRHLAELLQQKSSELDGASALLNWYEQQLLGIKGTEEQQLRLESEQNLVQIVTIHKSKGLEYPVCFVPFVSLARDNRRRPAPMLYHEDNRLVWDIRQTDEGWDKYKRETLAEDLRLLYVALTRPVYLCYLSIANHSRFTKNAGLSSQLWETAIGYLLGIEGKDCDFALLSQKAAALVCTSISVQAIADEIDASPFMDSQAQASTLCEKQLQRTVDIPWRVGSYSGLVKHLSQAAAQDPDPGIDSGPAAFEDAPFERADVERVIPGADDEGREPDFRGTSTVADMGSVSAGMVQGALAPGRFGFERGANAGSFLHLVLEEIDFKEARLSLPTVLPGAMAQYAIDERWLAVLSDWFQDLLCAPLKSTGLCLADLGSDSKLVEMEFYLPAAHLQPRALNRLLAKYGYGTNLAFDTLRGMLKGFIDLIFLHEGQYFIADYKSNHLGDSHGDYDTEAMGQAILAHRYDLQYLLYTLALHRYLKLRLADYDYERHIGGCYYLFLRGMSVSAPGCGVFYDKPPEALILALDALFRGETDQRFPEFEEQEA